MASPVAHSVIGLAMAILGWPMAGFPGALWWEGLKRVWPIWLACVILANAPDLDYLYGLPGGQLNAFHQTVTHTGIWCLSLILAVGLTDAGFHRRWWPRVWILALVLVGSHLGIDWMTDDTSPPVGMMLGWPWSDQWFHAPWCLFPSGARKTVQDLMSWKNVWMVVAELAVTLPVLAGALGYHVFARRNDST